MLLIVGCNPLPPTPVAVVDEEYVCEDYNYAITVPAGWILAEAPGCIIGMIADEDIFLNVVVSVEPTTKDIVGVFTDELEKMERSELYVDTNILNIGSNTIEFDYAMGERTHAVMELYVENGYAYSVIYQSYEDDFVSNEVEMASIADTFRTF